MNVAMIVPFFQVKELKKGLDEATVDFPKKK